MRYGTRSQQTIRPYTDEKDREEETTQERPYVERSDLRQINLIRQMAITHPIFVPINLLAPLRRLDEIAHVAVVVHFEVDADTPIECRAGAVDV